MLMRIATIRRVYEAVERRFCESSSDLYVSYLRRKGCKVGDRVKFHGQKSVDLTRPFLVEIGNDVTVTDGVIILTHGFEWSVLMKRYGDSSVLGSAGAVKIGNNVYIGTRSMILKGVSVGDNCIIGAGSIVTKDIPPETLACGAPARVVCPLHEYYEKRVTATRREFATLIRYMGARGVEINEEALRWEFFPLYKKRNEPLSQRHMRQLRGATSNYALTEPVWESLGNAVEKIGREPADEL